MRVPGGSYFFTVNLALRGATHLTDHIDALRRAFAVTLRERPVRIDAIVVMPDHLHAVWTLPVGDSDYSTRWRLIKSRFVRETGLVAPRSRSKVAKAERGIWQRRFWEHTIRGEADFAAHVAYCWQNPAKHGFVERAEDWPYSSYHFRGGRGDGCEHPSYVDHRENFLYFNRFGSSASGPSRRFLSSP
ncbi:REP-associated tyrosine transposase [Maritimibacter dapengensis]|uniref:REP-associated tyrosine transposase n=1 Tax=Maritimibacter dapengensis TaxID=2836868 RepID=UPI003AB9B606